MEDLLTSIVFGALKHLPAVWLGRFLSRAQDIDGSAPLAALADIRTVTGFKFWPRFPATESISFCEPDVELSLIDGRGNSMHLFIEAKFRSGKSSFDDGLDAGAEAEQMIVRDQLAREWEQLSASGSSNPTLIYLTADTALPHGDLREAQAELLRKGRDQGRILWLQWGELIRIVRDTSALIPSLLDDVVRTLQRLRLEPFDGVRLPRPMPPSWRFRVEKKHHPIEVPRSATTILWPCETMTWRYRK